MNENDFNRKRADYHAVLDDIQHAISCIKELQKLPDPSNTAKRAYWNSSLISFRRALKGAQTMYPGEGARREDPFEKTEPKSLIADSYHEEFDRFIFLSDKLVAHRTPIVNVRTIEVGDNLTRGRMRLFSGDEAECFLEILNPLSEFIMQECGSVSEAQKERLDMTGARKEN